MSPRPRTVEDSAILDAAFRALSRIGPEHLTLADVGAEAGLSAATLVQRFGSKRDLLLSLFRHATGAIDEGFLSAVLANDSPLDSLFAAAIGRAGPTDGPASIANRMAFFLSGIDDPEFHEHARGPRPSRRGRLQGHARRSRSPGGKASVFAPCDRITSPIRNSVSATAHRSSGWRPRAYLELYLFAGERDWAQPRLSP